MIKNQFYQTIKKLDADTHKLASNFDCGNVFINNFFQSEIARDCGIGQTYVWIDGEDTVVGFYSLTTGCIDEISGDERFKMGSSIHINEFALDQSFHGMIYPGTSLYVSDMLMGDCIRRIRQIRELVGFTFVTLYATKQGITLYERNGFERIEEDMSISLAQSHEEDCIPMYLPLDLE